MVHTCKRTSSSLDFILAVEKATVAINGETSGATPVKSGIPQGTVLGPLVFLVYINDINEGVTSSVWLFADDCVIYKLIKTPQDTEQLQDDLQKIIKRIKTR